MRRYLVDFDTAAMKKVYTDVLIIGSGIAGVYTALELGDRYDITVITKEEVEGTGKPMVVRREKQGLLDGFKEAK